MSGDDPVRPAELVLLRDPLRPEQTREVVPCAVGQWLAEAVPPDCLIGEWVAVDAGRVLARDEWARHLLTPGASVIVYPRLSGTIGKIVSGVVFPPLGVYWALREIGTPSWVAGLVTGGFVGMDYFPKIENIMAGKPTPQNVPVTSSDMQSSPTYGFGGISNSTRIGAPIPVVYGEHRVGGQLIGYSLATQDNNDVLNFLLALSEGQIESIHDIEINEQPIGNYTNVVVEVRQGSNSQTALTVFGDTGALTVTADAKLTTSFVTYTTQGTNINAFEVKITFPGGLYRLSDSGGFIVEAVTIEVDYKLVSSGTWIQAPRVTYSKGQRAAVRDRIRVDGLAAGQYDIRVRRTTDESTDVRKIDAVHREAITEIVSDGYTYPNVALLAVRAVATNQLSGGLPRVTCRVLGMKVKVWSSSLTYVVTYANNPAWAVFDILTSARYGHGRFTWRVLYQTGGLTVTNGSVNFSGTGTSWTAGNLRKGDVLHDPVGQAIGIVKTINYGAQTGTFYAVWGGASRTNGAYEVRSNDLDIQSFVQWANFCDESIPNGAGGFERRATCNFVFDAERENIWAAVLRICGIGQASLVKIGTYIRVKIERVTAPVQLFTMANIKADSFEEVFLPLKERANIFEVQFLNAANRYQQDVLVLEDPALFTNSDQPRRKTISGYGITRSSHAARLARFNRRVNQYVTRTITFEAALDAVACEPGDVIRFQHDIPQWGFGGRAAAGSTSSTIVLDRTVTIEAATTYEVLVRHADDTVETRTVTTGAGTVSTLTIAGTWAQTPARHDVWAFGPITISTKPFRVVTIERTQELDARITAVEYSADLYDDSDVGNTNQVNYSLLGDLIGAPGPVKDLALLEEDGAVQNVWVSFSPPGSSNFHHANIYRIDSGAKVLVGTSANGAFALSEVPSGTLVTVKVTSVSGLGVESDYASAPIASLVVSQVNPPDVPILVLEGDRLRWNYPNPPRDLAGFLVRSRPGTSRAWESATPAHNNVLLTTDLQIFRRSGVQTYLVKAVDKFGNQSVTAKALTVNFGGDVADNIVFTDDHAAMGWPGTITDGTIISNQIEAPSTALLWSGDDNALWWKASDAELWWSSVYGSMTYEFIVMPTADMLDAMLKLQLTMQGEWSIEYETDSTALWWDADSGQLLWTSDSALWWDSGGGYTQWPGQVDHLRQQPYKIRITGYAGTVQAILQQLTVILDVPDLVEILEDVPLAAGGSRLVLSKTYRKIVAVRWSLQESGGSAAYIKVIDKDVAGPLLQGFTTGGVGTAALVDVVVHGY